MGDDATVGIGGNRARYGWHGRGKGKTAPVTLSRDRKHAFGVLGDGESCCMSCDQKNSGVFIRFPGRVRRRFGKVPVFAYNASWHESKAVLRHVRECGDVRLEYFPPHAPELDGTGVQWRVMRNSMGNRLYADIGEAVGSIRSMIREKEIVPVKMNDYLMC